MVSLIRLFGSYAHGRIIDSRHSPLVSARMRRVHHLARGRRALENPLPLEPGEQGDDDGDGLVIPPPPWWRS